VLGLDEDEIPPSSGVTPDQKQVLDQWLASQASGAASDLAPEQAARPTPASGEAAALAQVRPEASAPVVAPARPNLRPFGMAPPPEVSRDRLGEIARTVLGVFAGKDKYARRGALADGLVTMISAKPGEEASKENYDRKLHAAQLSNADEVSRGRAASAGRDAAAARRLRELQINQAERSLGMRDEQAKRLGTKHDLETNPNNEAVIALKQNLYANGVPEGSLDQENLITLRANPAYRAQVALLYERLGVPIAAEQAGATAAASTGARINTEANLAPVAAQTAGTIATGTKIGAARGENIAAPLTADTQAQLGQVTERDSRFETAKQRFTADTEAAQKTAVAIDSILSHTGANGAAPPGLDPASRLGSKIPGVASMMSPETQTVLQNLDQVEEAYARDLSGAAISLKESAKFLKQIIGNPLYSGEQVTAALKRFRDANHAFLRSKAAVNPEAADAVLRANGIKIGSFSTPKQRPAKRPAAKPAASMADLDDL